MLMLTHLSSLTCLQSLGMTNTKDRSVVKRKIREMKCEVEKERKALEKELKTQERLKQKETRTRKYPASP